MTAQHLDDASPVYPPGAASQDAAVTYLNHLREKDVCIFTEIDKHK